MMRMCGSDLDVGTGIATGMINSSESLDAKARAERAFKVGVCQRRAQRRE